MKRLETIYSDTQDEYYLQVPPVAILEPPAALFPFLREEDHLALSPALGKVIRVLEFTQIERFIPSSRGYVGRPPKDRVALARAIVAKAVLDLPPCYAAAGWEWIGNSAGRRDGRRLPFLPQPQDHHAGRAWRPT